MIIIQSGRHPHEVLISLVLFLSGIMGLLPHTYPSATLSQLPVWSLTTFYVSLIIVSGVTLAGLFIAGVTGPLVERAGLLGTSVIMVLYGVAVLGEVGWSGIGFGTLTLGIGVASAWRAKQITCELKAVKVGAVLTDTLEQLGSDP